MKGYTSKGLLSKEKPKKNISPGERLRALNMNKHKQVFPHLTAPNECLDLPKINQNRSPLHKSHKLSSLPADDSNELMVPSNYLSYDQIRSQLAQNALQQFNHQDFLLQQIIHFQDSKALPPSFNPRDTPDMSHKEKVTQWLKDVPIQVIGLNRTDNSEILHTDCYPGVVPLSSSTVSNPELSFEIPESSIPTDLLADQEDVLQYQARKISYFVSKLYNMETHESPVNFDNAVLLGLESMKSDSFMNSSVVSQPISNSCNMNNNPTHYYNDTRLAQQGFYNDHQFDFLNNSHFETPFQHFEPPLHQPQPFYYNM